MSLRIVVLQRGWVYVGRYEHALDEVTVRDARCIHRWGTKKGLGEIANGGPTSQTVLQDPTTVRCHRLMVVHTIDCDESKWKAIYPPKNTERERRADA